MDHVRNLIVVYRRALVVLFHALLWAMSLVLAVLLRFEFEIPLSLIHI